MKLKEPLTIGVISLRNEQVDTLLKTMHLHLIALVKRQTLNEDNMNASLSPETHLTSLDLQI